MRVCVRRVAIYRTLAVDSTMSEPTYVSVASDASARSVACLEYSANLMNC